MATYIQRVCPVQHLGNVLHNTCTWTGLAECFNQVIVGCIFNSIQIIIPTSTMSLFQPGPVVCSSCTFIMSSNTRTAVPRTWNGISTCIIWHRGIKHSQIVQLVQCLQLAFSLYCISSERNASKSGIRKKLDL